MAESPIHVNILSKFENIASSLGASKEVSIGPTGKFTLRSLTAEEDTEAHEASNPFSKIAYLYALKIETLARSVIAVDGVDIPDPIETDQRMRGVPVKVRRHIWLKDKLGKFPQEVIDILFREYGVLAEEVSRSVDQNYFLGPQPISSEEAKAVENTKIRELVEKEVEDRRVSDEKERGPGDEKTNPTS